MTGIPSNLMSRYKNRIFVFHALADQRGEPLSWKVAASDLASALDALRPEITPQQFADINRVEVEKDSQAIIIAKE